MNPNLFIWTSDWHVGRAGNTLLTTQRVASHVASLAPAGVIDTGDCKDHAGAESATELDAYISSVRSVLPWAWVNPGANAMQPILPGNHDEVPLFYEPGAPNDFSLFDARFWSPPYHWTCDWQAPRIRFIGIHTAVRHENPFAGFFSIDPAEIDWLRAELAALSSDWQAIVCSHAPANPAFGAEVRAELGGAALREALADNSGSIVAYLNGHRHANMNTSVLNGIRHFNGTGIVYSQGNGYGGFVPIDYDSALRTLTFRYRLAYVPFSPFSGYTPVVIQLPPLPVTADTYTFSAQATLTGSGPLAGDTVLVSGAVEGVGTQVEGTTCSVEVS